MGLRMKNITRGHQFLGGAVRKNNIYGELSKKGGLEKNREEGVFEGSWYLDAHYDLIMVHTGT